MKSIENRMNQKATDDRDPSSTSRPMASPADRRDEAAHKDHFLQLMFFQASSAGGGGAPEPIAVQMTGDYLPLRHSMAKAGDQYTLPLPNAATPVRLDSPALHVMTDLRKVGAVTIDGDASIDTANRTMIEQRVRALFVVGEARQVLGIITATDVLGERPIQFAQARGIRHHDVVVRDIMTPAERLEVLNLRDVEGARVGDMIATLKVAGRQHALAVETIADKTAVRKAVCGIFSLTQLARQLGIPQHQMHDIARTFAEIEAVIGS
jgi:CBS domain-containing protein